MDSWKMAHFLKQLKFKKRIWLNVMVSPKNIPVATCFERAFDFPPKIFCYFFDDFIVSD